MRATQIRPTGVERTFGPDEIIVTKTDPRGLLTYANEVFLRVSALTEEAAVGQPHNIIRHPDMPQQTRLLALNATAGVLRSEVIRFVSTARQN